MSFMPWVILVGWYILGLHFWYRSLIPPRNCGPALYEYKMIDTFLAKLASNSSDPPKEVVQKKNIHECLFSGHPHIKAGHLHETKSHWAPGWFGGQLFSFWRNKLFHSCNYLIYSSQEVVNYSFERALHPSISCILADEKYISKSRDSLSRSWMGIKPICMILLVANHWGGKSANAKPFLIWSSHHWPFFLGPILNRY